MPIPLTRPVGTVISDAVPTNKAHHRDLFNDLINGTDAIEANLLAMIRRTGPILLTNIGGTGSAITASLDPSFGVTTISNTHLILFQPILANSTQNPTVTVGGTTFDVRSADDGIWPANAFQPSRLYGLMRFGPRLRVMVESSRADLATERANRINNIVEAGNIELTNVGGTATAITASIPSGLAGTGITASNVRRVTITLPFANGAGATLSIDGSEPLQLRNSAGQPLGAGRVQADRPTTLFRVQNRWRVLQDLVAEDLATLTGRADATDALIGGEVRRTIVQMTGDIPARPLPKEQGLFEWEVFDPLPAFPLGPMGPYDTQSVLQSAEPDVPTDDTWDFRNAGNGTQGVVRIFAVPPTRPSIEGIQYALDDGPFASIPNGPNGLPVPGDYLVPAAAGSRAVALRHVNFRGFGIESLARTREIFAGGVTFAIPASGTLHNAAPVDWQLIYQDGAVSRGMQVNAGWLRPSHDNAATRIVSREWFPTDQWIEGEIEQLFPSLTSRQGAGFGVNCDRDGNAGFLATFQTSGVFLFRASGPNSYTQIASASLTIAPTSGSPVQIRVAREGSQVRVRVNGDNVIVHDLTGDAASITTTGGAPMLYSRAPGTTDSRLQIRFRPLTAGRG